MCTVLLPPGVNPIAVNKYVNNSMHDEAYKMFNLNLNFELYCWGSVVMCFCKGRK